MTALMRPMTIGDRTLPPLGLVLLAGLGGVLLLVVVATFWMLPNDALAYWIAGDRLANGQSVYTTGDAAFEPYAFHYPPPLAQVLAPVTVVLPPVAYVALYRVIQLLAVWLLADRRFLPMLALIAFVPVAVELRFENVHLLMALTIALGLARWPWLFAVGALVKVSPGLGIVYLALRGQWRAAAVASVVGVAVVGVSVALDPALWTAWLDSITGRAAMAGNSLIPVPYLVRAAAGLALAAAGGQIGRRTGELLLVLAVTLANPNLALNGFAVLAAAVPVWRAGPGGLLARRDATGEAPFRTSTAL